MKEGTHPYVPPVSHARGGSIEASLNPQASEFIPSGTSGSAGQAAAAAATTATARKAALSHQDYRLDAPAPSTKQSRKRSTAGERNSRQHGRTGRSEGPSRNPDLRVLHGAAVNESATAVAMRALGTNTRTSSSARFGTNAGAALEKPERRRGGRSASTRNKNGISGGVVATHTINSTGGTRQGRDAPAEQESMMRGYDGDARRFVHSSATSTPATAAAAAAAASSAMPHRRASSSTIDRRRSAASRWVHRRTG